jgi:hypothetical protein
MRTTAFGWTRQRGDSWDNRLPGCHLIPKKLIEQIARAIRRIGIFAPEGVWRGATCSGSSIVGILVAT